MRPFRILLVEDNPDHADLQSALLSEGSGATEVHTVHDGRSALSFLDERRRKPDSLPHLILLDINMPGIDGFDVLERIKRDGELLRIPVVMLSTSRSDSDIRRAMSAHANSFATKSEDYEEMEKNLRRIRSYWMEINAR